MEKNHWIKTINKIIPYMTRESLSKHYRNSWDVGRHNNITFELHLILQGSCQFEVEGSTFLLQEGQAIIIRPEAFHVATQVFQPFLRISLPFFIQDLSLLPEGFPAEKAYFIFHTTPAIRQICSNILKEHDEPTPCFHQEMMSLLFSQLWIQIFQLITPRTVLEERNQNTMRSDIQNIDYFFSCFYTENRSRKALADLMHCSERHVNRILMQLYGLNYRQLKQKSQMEQAEYQLRETDKSISEICTAIGYTDETTFYKTFKARYHMTPQEYRKKAKEDARKPAHADSAAAKHSRGGCDGQK